MPRWQSQGVSQLSNATSRCCRPPSVCVCFQLTPTHVYVDYRLRSVVQLILLRHMYIHVYIYIEVRWLASLIGTAAATVCVYSRNSSNRYSDVVRFCGLPNVFVQLCPVFQERISRTARVTLERFAGFYGSPQVLWIFLGFECCGRYCASVSVRGWEPNWEEISSLLWKAEMPLLGNVLCIEIPETLQRENEQWRPSRIWCNSGVVYSQETRSSYIYLIFRYYSYHTVNQIKSTFTSSVC